MSRMVTLAVFLALVVMAAWLGSQFPAGEYYALINKPAWAPPAWLFGPVWSVLYVMMAVAMWLVWERGVPARLGALAWWLMQLTLNAAWTWLFFGLTRIGWAMAELGLLIGLVILCIKAFSLISKPAAWLMLPYLLWLVFALVLNFSIWSLNGGGISF
ncbi:MAG TPA: TspO/MBR family protein [Xanthomonadales bacterium]|nr:TspO/MBR family protein [Xanthomonadales bacterium]